MLCLPSKWVWDLTIDHHHCLLVQATIISLTLHDTRVLTDLPATALASFQSILNFVAE